MCSASERSAAARARPKGACSPEGLARLRRACGPAAHPRAENMRLGSPRVSRLDYPAQDPVLAWELAFWIRKSLQVTEIYAEAWLEVLVGNTVGVRVPLRARRIFAPYVPSTKGAKA